MSLSKQDLVAVSGVVSDAIRLVVEPRFDHLEAKVDGLETKVDKLDGRMGSTEGAIKRLEQAQRETNRRLGSLETKMDDALGRLESLENDVKEIYQMLAGLQKQGLSDPKFSKLSAEKRLLTVHAELVTLAKQLNVKLPS